MKLSNNALNFLLAQYRAIFKRAYVKGLASAVLLTAGLAAGAAQAADIKGAASWGTATDATFNSGDTYKTSDGTTDYFNKLTVASGELNLGANKFRPTYIKDSLTIESTGTLKLGNASGDTSLIYTWESDPATSVATLTNKGTLVVGAQAALAAGSGSTNSLSFNRVVLASNSKTEIGGSVYNSLTAFSNYNNIYAGWGDSGSFLIESGAQVTLKDYSAIASEKNSTFTIEDGATINFTLSDDAGAFIRAVAATDDSAQSAILNIGAANLNVTKSGTAAIFANNASLNGTKISVGADGTLKLTGDYSDAQASTYTIGNSTNAAGLFTANNAEIKVDGTLVVDGSTTGEGADKVLNKVTLTGGTLTGTGTVEVLGHLALTESLLDGFVNANNAGHIKTASGSSIIEVTSTSSTPVDLADYSFSGSDSADFVVSAATTIKGNNLAVSSALMNASNAAAGVSDNLTLEATNLTLGSNSAKSPTESLGFKSATARNLTVLASDGAFKLYDDVTLRSISGTDNVVASGGTIQGDLAIASGKTFTVDGGIYQTNDDFTVNAGGTLAVTNTKGANQSSLDLNRGIKFDLTSTGNAQVTVNGSLTDEYKAGDKDLAS